MEVRPVALVTGSSSGMGQASARLFGERGFDVVVNYTRDGEVRRGERLARGRRALRCER